MRPLYTSKRVFFPAKIIRFQHQQVFFPFAARISSAEDHQLVFYSYHAVAKAAAICPAVSTLSQLAFRLAASVSGDMFALQRVFYRFNRSIKVKIFCFIFFFLFLIYNFSTFLTAAEQISSSFIVKKNGVRSESWRTIPPSIIPPVIIR